MVQVPDDRFRRPVLVGALLTGAAIGAGLGYQIGWSHLGAIAVGVLGMSGAAALWGLLFGVRQWSSRSVTCS